MSNRAIALAALLVLACACDEGDGPDPTLSSTGGGAAGSGGERANGGSANGGSANGGSAQGGSANGGSAQGSGGEAGGASTLCVPGSTIACYGGPPGTEGVGSCVSGTQTCNASGTAYAACEGEVRPTFDACSTPEDEDCSGSAAPACSGNPTWAKRFGDASDQRGTALATDAVGDVFVGGSYWGSPSFGGAPLPEGASSGAFLATYDGTGAHQWSKGFPFDVTLNALAPDGAGGVIATGSYSGYQQVTNVDFGGGKLVGGGGQDVFVARFDGAGDHVWSKGFPSLGDQLSYAVAVDPSGNVLVTGAFYGTLDLGGGPLVSAGATDLFIAKLASDGSLLFSERYGGAGGEYPTGVATDAQGNIVVVGYFMGSLDFGYGPMQSSTIDDGFVVKLDPDGNPLWNRGSAGTGWDRVAAVAIDEEGDVVITGGFEETIDWGGGPLASAGGFDAFVAKLGPDGEHLFSRRFGATSGDQGGSAVAVDPTGSIVVAGGFQSTIDFGAGSLDSAGGYDVFIAKLLPSGDTLWSRRAGDAAEQQAAAVAVDPSANVFVTGRFQGFINLASPLRSAGSNDVFLAKLMP